MSPYQVWPWCIDTCKQVKHSIDTNNAKWHCNRAIPQVQVDCHSIPTWDTGHYLLSVLWRFLYSGCLHTPCLLCRKTWCQIWGTHHGGRWGRHPTNCRTVPVYLSRPTHSQLWSTHHGGCQGRHPPQPCRVSVYLSRLSHFTSAVKYTQWRMSRRKVNQALYSLCVSLLANPQSAVKSTQWSTFVHTMEGVKEDVQPSLV